MAVQSITPYERLIWIEKIISNKITSVSKSFDEYKELSHIETINFLEGLMADIKELKEQLKDS